MKCCFNTLRPRQNGRHFADDTFKSIFMNENDWIKIKISSWFPRVQLTIFQHWFRYWLGADQATSHYLKQWWLDCWRIYASLGLDELSHTVNDLQSRYFYWTRALEYNDILSFPITELLLNRLLMYPACRHLHFYHKPGVFGERYLHYLRQQT